MLAWRQIGQRRAQLSHGKTWPQSPTGQGLAVIAQICRGFTARRRAVSCADTGAVL